MATFPPVNTVVASPADVIPTWFRDYTLQDAILSEPSRWIFCFSSGASILVECLWRIADSNSIKLTSEDHQQKFGHPTPIDACVRVKELLQDSRVVELSADPHTFDLTIAFSNRLRLEILVDSTGYESWKIEAPNGTCIVAQGGGQLCKFES